MIIFTPLRRFVPVLILVLIVFSACISKTKDDPAQTAAPAAAETSAPTPAPYPSELVAGGFVSISKDSPGARHAYEFLKDKLSLKYPQLELGALTAAAAQVVAGVKTRLVCEYTETGKSAPVKSLIALVFIDLDGNDSLMEVNLEGTAP